MAGGKAGQRSPVELLVVRSHLKVFEHWSCAAFRETRLLRIHGMGRGENVELHKKVIWKDALALGWEVGTKVGLEKK